MHFTRKGDTKPTFLRMSDRPWGRWGKVDFLFPLTVIRDVAATMRNPGERPPPQDTTAPCDIRAAGGP
jgi:hypothetical protein